MKPYMPFSWKALLIAPLTIPLVCTVLVMVLAGPARVPWAFLDYLFYYLILFLLGCVVSYGAVIFLLLPGLFLVSRFLVLEAWLVWLVGVFAGLFVYLVYLWVWYRSSGPDSGPPIGTFVDFLFLYAGPFGWDCWLILGAGLVTAMQYWMLLGSRRTG